MNTLPPPKKKHVLALWFKNKTNSNSHAALPGIPMTGPGNKPIKASAAPPTGLPPVLKSENASDVILKYLDGILKRSQKMADPWLKRELN